MCTACRTTNRSGERGGHLERETENALKKPKVFAIICNLNYLKSQI
jgi:hypothetical protein